MKEIMFRSCVLHITHFVQKTEIKKKNQIYGKNYSSPGWTSIMFSNENGTNR